MTPLVTVTHYPPRPPSLRSESVLIVVMSVLCISNPKICSLYLPDLSDFDFVMVLLKYWIYYSL